jgi:hypothetical protein
MARDFDSFPTYDPVIKSGSLYLSSVWSDFVATFVQTLQEYLSQYGIFVPRLSEEERDDITTPVLGQLIFNTTTSKFQGYEGSPGVWTNLI